MEKQKLLKAVVVGSTGAVGRELVEELLKSNTWEKVCVISRKTSTERWDRYPESMAKKLNLIHVETFDVLADPTKIADLTGYDTFFSCLGTTTDEGKEQFWRVDHDYVEYSARLALHNKIRHFSVLTSKGAMSNSWIYYFEVKGKIEETLVRMSIPLLSIFRPGVIRNREGQEEESFTTKFLKALPLVDKVDVLEVARALRIESELIHTGKITIAKPLVYLYTNDDIIKLAKEGNITMLEHARNEAEKESFLSKPVPVQKVTT